MGRLYSSKWGRTHAADTADTRSTWMVTCVIPKLEASDLVRPASTAASLSTEAAGSVASAMTRCTAR